MTFNSLKKYFSVEALLIGSVLLIHLAAASASAQSVVRWYHVDDAYYYFVVARNIVTGHGITFDQLGLANGFHPLWMVICVLVYFVSGADAILPLRIIFVVQGLLFAGSAVFLFRLLKRYLSIALAATVALVWALAPLPHHILAETGLETSLNTFCLSALLYWGTTLGEKDQPRARDFFFFGTVAALTVFSRLDNIFIVGIFGLWVIWRGDVRKYLLADLVGSFIIVLISGMLRLGLGTLFYSFSTWFIFLIMLTGGAGIVSAFLLGLYQPAKSWLQLGWRATLTSAIAVAVGFVGSVIFAKAGLSDGYPRSVLFILFPLLALYYFVSRFILPATASENNAMPGQLLRSSWKMWLTRLTSYFSPLIVTLVIYMAWNQNTFGTPLPISGQIKRWWGTLAFNPYGRPAESPFVFFGLAPTSPNWDFIARALNGLAPAQFIPLIVAGLLIAGAAFILYAHFRKRLSALAYASLPPLIAGGGLQVWIYSTQAYIHYREWYWVLQMLMITIALALICDTALGLISNATIRTRTTMILLGALLLVTIFQAIPYFASGISYKDSADRAYLAFTTELAAHTEPGSLIGMTGGGDTAYFIADRHIVNLDGLINSNEYYETLKAGRAADYLNQIGLDYVLGHPNYLFASEPYVWTFKTRLEPVTVLGNYTLYRYIPDP